MKTIWESEFFRTITSTIQEHNMLKGIQNLIIAFSAGPDSVCLLDVLKKLYPNLKMYLVYVNHGLRPAKYTRVEENLTKKYAAKYNCNYKIIKIKIKKTKYGPEATARIERYKAFLQVMKKTGCSRIAQGHNLDDMVETYFMNLIRGSGSRGLGSIPASRGSFIRPLINVRKRDILLYLKNKKFKYSDDKTNLRLDYRRNMIRHRIIPILLKLNPDLHMTIAREINLLRIDDRYLEQLAEEVFNKTIKINKNHVIIDIKRTMDYNPAIANRVLRMAIKYCSGTLDGYESKHFAAIFRLIDSKSGKKIDLPKNFCAWREYDKLIIGREQKERSIDKKIDLTEKSVKVAGLHLEVKIAKPGRIKAAKHEEVFDLDQLILPIKIRTRKDGDTLLSRSGRVKLKKVFQEKKVPYLMRKAPVLLCDRKGILWVIGIKRAYRAFVNKETKRILMVNFEYID